MKKMNLLSKKELRKEILARRDAFPQKEREQKSAQISKKVTALHEFQKGNKILMYASMRSEVETNAIYRDARRLGKDIYYPRVMGEKMEFYLVDKTTEFETSAFGVREPKIEPSKQFMPNEEDVIIMLMPGVVFDKEGNRIGYGGGYYDKYLDWLSGKIEPENICKVAVAYECQMVGVGRIEREEYDIRPDYIVTESETYVIGKDMSS